MATAYDRWLEYRYRQSATYHVKLLLKVWLARQKRRRQTNVVWLRNLKWRNRKPVTEDHQAVNEPKPPDARRPQAYMMVMVAVLFVVFLAVWRYAENSPILGGYTDARRSERAAEREQPLVVEDRNPSELTVVALGQAPAVEGIVTIQEETDGTGTDTDVVDVASEADGAPEPNQYDPDRDDVQGGEGDQPGTEPVVAETQSRRTERGGVEAAAAATTSRCHWRGVVSAGAW